MISKEITIRSKTGLHARPASQLVSLVKGFQSKVVIMRGAKTASGTSIINILALGLRCGSEVDIYVDGPDELDALKTITDFFNKLED